MRGWGASRGRESLGRLVAVMVILLACAAAPVAHPRAATITVNSTADTIADDGFCTLREAIIAANNNVASGAMSGECRAGTSATTDVITFDTTVFNTVRTITLTNAQLPIVTEGVTITGPGATMLTVRRDAANATRFRIFQISSGSPVTISGLTISGGNVGDANNADSGGGISSGGTNNNLTLDGVRVTGNTTNGGNDSGGGGGILANGTLTVRNSAIANNNTVGIGTLGGGLWRNAGPGALTIENSTFSGNTAGSGGGISFSANASSNILRISGSTFSGNTATGVGGGGLRANTSGFAAYITNSTFSGNTNPSTNTFGGGGILIQSDGLVVTHSTIAGNSTAGNGADNGGGIHVLPGKAITLHGTLIAGNTAAGGANDVSGDVASGSSFNLIGDGMGLSGISDGTGSNIVGTAASPVAPRLAPLGNYGGSTQTRALLPGSPALDAAGATCPTDPRTGMALAVDQRDIARPQPATGGACDIGAFESRGFTLAASTGATQRTTAGRPFPIALAATLAPVDTGVPLSGATVTFTINPMSGATGTFAGGTTTATAPADANGVATAPALTAGATAGMFTVTASAARATNAAYPLAVNPSPTIGTTTLPATTVGVAYNQTVTATGGTAPFAYTATGLPTGLMIGTNSGTISGTPTMAGASTVMVTVTDAAGATANQTLSLLVNLPVAIAKTTLPAATTNRPYSQTVAATGGTGTLTYAATGLPTGLMLNGITGTITGTTTATGPFVVTIAVTDANGTTVTRMLTLSVNNAVPAITALSPNGARPGSPALALTVTGTGFVSSSVVRFNGTNLTTAYVSPTQLTAQIPANAVATAGAYTVAVVNGTPGGGTSNALIFTLAVPNAVPGVRSTAPTMGVPNVLPSTPRATAPAMGVPNAFPPRR